MTVGVKPRSADAPPSVYPAYVLGILCLTFVFNWIDRAILNILQEPIKHEFHLSDFQLGLLGGPAFALLYLALGIPIARLAERANRVTIVALSVAVWSVGTALCGIVTSFPQLLFARMSVSAGEAGAVPASHAIISDYFLPGRRTRAFAIHSLGSQIGTFIASMAGGWVAQYYGWRAAFIVCAIPGLLLALAVKVTVREPVRRGNRTDSLSFVGVLRVLCGKPAYRHLLFGAGAVSFVAFSLFQYLNSFLMRAHGLTIEQASIITGIVLGICAAIGLLSSGFIGDWLSDRWPRAITWLPGLGLVTAAPLYIVAFLTPSLWLCLTALIGAAIAHFFYIGPMFSIAQGLAEPKMRATSTAILLFILTLIGTFFGPPVIGALSDYLASLSMQTMGLTPAVCRAGSPGTVQVCAVAQGEGLRWALALGVLSFLWGGGHFVLIGRTLARDLVT